MFGIKIVRLQECTFVLFVKYTVKSRHTVQRLFFTKSVFMLYCSVVYSIVFELIWTPYHYAVPYCVLGGLFKVPLVMMGKLTFFSDTRLYLALTVKKWINIRYSLH